MKIIPRELAEANAFIVKHHRHHSKIQGHRFSIGAEKKGGLCGVAVVGRPVARRINQHEVVEVTRLCTDGTPNACSFLYSACARIARELGYKKIITYILKEETGASLIAAGWKCEGIAGGGDWHTPQSGRSRMTKNLFGEKKYPTGEKLRWSKVLDFSA